MDHKQLWSTSNKVTCYLYVYVSNEQQIVFSVMYKPLLSHTLFECFTVQA